MPTSRNRSASPVRVMLSSKCATKLTKGFLSPKSSSSMSDIRAQLKADIDKVTLSAGCNTLFEVWTNEDAPTPPVSESVEQTSVRQVREADVVVVLYTGDEGQPHPAGARGICYVEARTAEETRPSSTFVIDISSARSKPAPSNAWLDELRAAAVVASVNDYATLLEEILKVLNDWLVSSAKRGAAAASGRSADAFGEKLDWTKLSLTDRQLEIVAVLTGPGLVGGTPVPGPVLGSRVAEWPRGAGTAAVVSAIPGAFSRADARAAWGRPELYDHQVQLNELFGPLHLVGVGGAVTTLQAAGLLNNPNATIVRLSFGVWAADPVLGLQFMFLRDCHDPLTTRERLQDAEAWLAKSLEIADLKKRAEQRSKVMAVI